MKNDLTNEIFDKLASKITSASTRTSWKWMDGSVEHHVFTALNKAGQSWYYTIDYNEFGEAEQPCLELIELGRDEPGFCGIPTFNPILQIYRDCNGVHIATDKHNLKAKLERV